MCGRGDVEVSKQRLRSELNNQNYGTVIELLLEQWEESLNRLHTIKNQAERLGLQIDAIGPQFAELFQPQYKRDWSCVLLQACRHKPGMLTPHLETLRNCETELPETIRLRAETIRLVTADLKRDELSNGIDDLFDGYRNLWHTELWTGAITTATTARPAAWAALYKRNKPLATLLQQIVEANPLRWQDPAATFLADALLECSGGHIEPADSTEIDRFGRTWVLIAIDDKYRYTATPGGLLLLLHIERLPDGCGAFYPHTDHAAHLQLDKSFQESLRNACQVVLGHAESASDIRRCDYRWRLEVIDDSHENSIVKNATPEENPDGHRHRLRRLVSFIPLTGRSGEFALSAGLKSAAHRIPLDLSRAATGQFAGSPPTGPNPIIDNVSSVVQKELGLDLSAAALQRCYNLGRIQEIVIAQGQPVTLPSNLKTIEAIDFEKGVALLSEYSQLTQRYHQACQASTKQWFREHCFADDEHPTGSYILNRMRRWEVPNAPELSEDQTELLTKGRVSEALAGDDMHPKGSTAVPRRLVKIIADSGIGKTSFLVYSEYQISHANSERIAIRIEHLTSFLANSRRSDFLDAAVTQIVSLLSPFTDRNDVVRAETHRWLERKADQGAIVWLLDALDQMSRHREHVAELAKSFPSCPMFLTLRPDADQRFGDIVQDRLTTRWVRFDLLTFGEEDARRYLGQYADLFFWRLRVEDDKFWRFPAGTPSSFKSTRLPIEIRMDGKFRRLYHETRDGYETIFYQNHELMGRDFRRFSEEIRVEGDVWTTGSAPSPGDGPVNRNVQLDEQVLTVPLLLHLLKDLAMRRGIDPNASNVGLLELGNRYGIFTAVMAHRDGLVAKGLQSLKHTDCSIQKPLRDFTAAIFCMKDLAWHQVHEHHFDVAVREPLYSQILDRLETRFGQDVIPAIHQLNVVTQLPMFDESLEGSLKWRHRSFLEYFAGCRLAEEYCNTATRAEAVSLLRDIHSILDDDGEVRRELLDMAGETVRHLPREWSWTLRFALSHAQGKRRDDLAWELIQLGNPWVVYEGIARDDLKLDVNLDLVCRWLVHREHTLMDQHRLAWVDKTKPPPVAAFLARCGKKLQEVLQALLLRRSTRDGAYLSPLLELLEATEQEARLHRDLLDVAAICKSAREQYLAESHELSSAVLRRLRNREQFVPIPAGEFDPRWYHDRYWLEKAGITGSVRIESGLKMMDFPVTNAELETWCPTQIRQRESYNHAEDQPAVMVSWFMGQEFCRWLTGTETAEVFGLPTEWEWEYACRAGNSTNYRYWWGDATQDDLCWHSGAKLRWGIRSRKKTLQAESAAGIDHPWGLHDMHGNVDEQCVSLYDSKANVVLGCRIVRGGSWGHTSADACSAARRHRDPDFRDVFTGLRLVSRCVVPLSKSYSPRDL